jgi:hypothetical protein
MEVVSYVAGEPFSDFPECACPVMGAFLRNWNDSLGDESRQMLRQFVPLLVNSRGTRQVEHKRFALIEDWYFRVYAPAFLDLAKFTELAEEGREKGKAANWAAAGYVAWNAAGAAAWAAAWDAAWDALKPTVLRLQKSALQLVRDCLAITK